jgi:pyruvate/2-oxoglutarate dehydrogenase complex dihydrolipoamide acyltransferase (E2) component
MPWFKRPDGDLVTDENPVRRMIPYLMLGRNESVVYHDEWVDLTRARPWIREYNRAHLESPITLFHLCLFAIARGFHGRPGMNRFVSGGRIYQRKGVFLSFAAKKQFDEKSALVTVKLPFPPDEKFADCVTRIKGAIGEGRSDKVTTVDKELKFALALPGPLLSFAMSLLRFLDRFNLMPKAMIDSDPMYTSAFVANLGSVAIDRTYHHMYEYGTASLFCVIGPPKKAVVAGPGDQPVVKEMVELRWSFDERINDGFYCAMALRVASRILEDPERYLGPPAGAAVPAPEAAAAATSG